MTDRADASGFTERAGQVGVWLPPTVLDATAAYVLVREVARIDALGYGSVWTGERLVGAEAFARHGQLLASSRRLVVGTGIANLWARVPEAMRGGAVTLAAAYPGRFVLGIGTSTPNVVERIGATYDRPLARMRAYLERMDAVEGPPDATCPRVLAALGPKMLELAAELTDGAHPFLTPVEHTAFARTVLGPDKLLIPHQTVVLTDDRDAARAAIRATYGPLLELATDSPYVANLRRLGYQSDDSERVLDALFGYGDTAAITDRVQQHLDAGADHVLIQPFAAGLTEIVDQLEELRSALLA
ncbi:TIGR03620 family F420-dependent LLM class oxidoreductase [Kribbella sp. NPDC026611]|uniref:TIGR03620 family F420-dependent LLM class oxidoreductase n=1 Tax=Kribbella sp. NPDC026611 TaxID=3154911 RepID=UPI00340FAB5E